MKSSNWLVCLALSVVSCVFASQSQAQSVSNEDWRLIADPVATLDILTNMHSTEDTCCDVDLYLAPNPPHPSDLFPLDPNGCYSQYVWKLVSLTLLFREIAKDECEEVSILCEPGFLDCDCLEMVRTKTPVLIDGVETTIPDLQNQYYIEYLSCLLIS